MADFEVTITAGVSLVVWEDPAATGPSRPSRVNPRARQAHMRWLGTVGTPITIEAIVNGEQAPMDGDLDGREFTASVCEGPGLAPVPGAYVHSSRRTFTPPVAGHYLIEMRRLGGGGAVLLHLDAEDP